MTTTANTSKLVACPTCAGTGKEKIESTLHEPGKAPQKSVLEIKCVICAGGGRITPRMKKAVETRVDDFWCHCKTPSEDVTFHDDFECRDCQKHHYHCGTCHKISQVG